MSSLDRTTLKGKFENGDTPQGSDYGDLIDSCLNLAETTAQTMLGPLVFAGGLSAATVAGGTGSFAGTVSAATFHGNVIASTVTAGTVTTSAIASPGGSISFSANLGLPSGYHLKEAVASVACLGTTQTSGTLLVAAVNVLRTVATGANDAVRLPGFYPGATFTIINNTTGSARIFPPSGGAIDALSTDAELSLGPRGGGTGRAVIWCETSTQAHAVRSS